MACLCCLVVGVLALDYRTPISEAIGILEELSIQSLAVVCHSFVNMLLHWLLIWYTCGIFMYV